MQAGATFLEMVDCGALDGTLEGHAGGVRSACATPDGHQHHVVTALADKTARACGCLPTARPRLARACARPRGTRTRRA